MVLPRVKLSHVQNPFILLYWIYPRVDTSLHSQYSSHSDISLHCYTTFQHSSSLPGASLAFRSHGGSWQARLDSDGQFGYPRAIPSFSLGPLLAWLWQRVITIVSHWHLSKDIVSLVSCGSTIALFCHYLMTSGAFTIKLFMAVMFAVS